MRCAQHQRILPVFCSFRLMKRCPLWIKIIVPLLFTEYSAIDVSKSGKRWKILVWSLKMKSWNQKRRNKFKIWITLNFYFHDQNSFMFISFSFDEDLQAPLKQPSIFN
jgi:hypothetical protein